jgi:hypothetical protein
MGNDFEEISDPTEIGIGYTNWMKKILSMEESFPSITYRFLIPKF